MKHAGVDRAGEHPLLADDQRQRLEVIVAVMHQAIVKVLRVPIRVGQERALSGGASVDDVLQESLLALVTYDPSKLKESWERLAARIARNKAVDAVRLASRGRKNASGGEIEVISLDREIDPTGRKLDPMSPRPNLEYEFNLIYQQLVLSKLAREHLDDRELRIFFEIHYKGRSGVDVGRELGITGTRVRQIYARVATRLLGLALNDPLFSSSWEAEKGSTEKGRL